MIDDTDLRGLNQPFCSKLLIICGTIALMTTQTEKIAIHRVLNTLCRNHLLLMGDHTQLPLIEDIRISRAYFLNPTIHSDHPKT